MVSREKCGGKKSNSNHWDGIGKNLGLWREKILYFQERNKLNFQSGLGMEDPSRNKIILQPDLQLLESVSWFLAPSCGKKGQRRKGPRGARFAQVER